MHRPAARYQIVTASPNGDQALEYSDSVIGKQVMTSIPRPRIEAILSDAGLEMTPQRFAIIEFLGKNEAPQSLDRVCEQLQRVYPRPSREFIERLLLMLRDRGIVLEDSVADITRYALNLSHPSLSAEELDED